MPKREGKATDISSSPILHQCRLSALYTDEAESVDSKRLQLFLQFCSAQKYFKLNFAHPLAMSLATLSYWFLKRGLNFTILYVLCRSRRDGVVGLTNQVA